MKMEAKYKSAILLGMQEVDSIYLSTFLLTGF
jgi:hypothetical protein